MAKSKLKLKPEIKKKWLAALRSRKYKKTTLKLRDSGGGGFCCLGVLADLYVKEKGIESPWMETGAYSGSMLKISNKKGIDGHQSYAVLPKKVSIWAGLGKSKRADNPIMACGKSLSELNDGDNKTKPMSFNKIAKLIEAEL